jgi:hypothetical protein
MDQDEPRIGTHATKGARDRRAFPAQGADAGHHDVGLKSAQLARQAPDVGETAHDPEPPARDQQLLDDTAQAVMADDDGHPETRGVLVALNGWGLQGRPDHAGRIVARSAKSHWGFDLDEGVI